MENVLDLEPDKQKMEWNQMENFLEWELERWER